MKRIVDDLMPGVAWAGALLLLALAASLARTLDLVDQETTFRLVIGANGLMIAWFGNRAPKMLAPSACAQRLARFTGWSMTLGGIAYALLWAFAPVQRSILWGTIAIMISMIATLGYSLYLRWQTQTAQNGGGQEPRS